MAIKKIMKILQSKIIFTLIILCLLSGKIISQTIILNAVEITITNKITNQIASFNVDFIIIVTVDYMEFEGSKQKWTYVGPTVEVSEDSFYSPVRDSYGILCKLWFYVITFEEAMLGLEYKNYNFVYKVLVLKIEKNNE